MIIIEGPDNSGKTTLIKYLMEHLNDCYLYKSKGPPDDKSMLQEMNDMIYAHAGTRTLCDRIPCISERVYGPILRGSNLLKDQLFFNNLIHHSQTPIIYCRPPNATLMVPKFRADEEMGHIEAVKQNAIELVLAYDRVMAEVYHVIYYDFTLDMKTGQTRKIILNYIKLYWEKMEMFR